MLDKNDYGAQPSQIRSVFTPYASVVKPNINEVDWLQGDRVAILNA